MLRSLARAWRFAGEDPVRILGVAMFLLLLDVVTGLVVYALATTMAPGALVPWLGALLLLRAVVRAPARARLVAWGLEANGAPPIAVDRAAVALVEVARAPLVLVAAAAGAIVPLGVASALLAQGMLPAAALAFGAASLGAYGVALAPRALGDAVLVGIVTRDAPLEEVLWAPLGSWSYAIRLTLISDLLRTMGALALVVGALPAYPLGLLAMVARSRPPQPEPA